MNTDMSLDSCFLKVKGINYNEYAGKNNFKYINPKNITSIEVCSTDDRHVVFIKTCDGDKQPVQFKSDDEIEKFTKVIGNAIDLTA